MNLIAGFVKLFTGVQARWSGCAPVNRQRVFFANHTSHFDFLILWAVLPASMRNNTVAAGAKDYWAKTRIRRWLADDVFHVILIDRENVTRTNNPITTLVSALDQGKSLIIFPEGGRSCDGQLHEFKSGLYHLAKRRPNVDLIPTYIDNANRVLPKGEFIAIPLICSVSFGAPVVLVEGEEKDSFLRRAKSAIECQAYALPACEEKVHEPV